MRVLYFSPRPCWPPSCGANLRDYYLVRALSRWGDVTYLGFSDSQQEAVWFGKQGAQGELDTVLVSRTGGFSASNVVRGLIGPTPVSVLNYTSALMEQQLRKLLDEFDFDFVQIEGVHLSAYLPVIRAAKSRPRIICDWHNIESEIMRRYSESGAAGMAKRLYAAHTARLLERLENRLLIECDWHLVCSERERRVLSGRVPYARILVVPNGVDYAFASALPQTLEPAARQDVVFVGSMDYHANADAAVHFASDIWPRLRAAYPALRFVIVGARPLPEVLALAEQPGITVTGTVDDVRPYYQTAAAVVAPIRVGGGTRLKIVEAMAAGVPVIASRLGAEGLAVTEGHDILLADTAEEFVAAFALVTRDRATWNRIASAGGQTARSYDWPVIGENLHQVYGGDSLAVR